MVAQVCSNRPSAPFSGFALQRLADDLLNLLPLLGVSMPVHFTCQLFVGLVGLLASPVALPNFRNDGCEAGIAVQRLQIRILLDP